MPVSEAGSIPFRRRAALRRILRSGVIALCVLQTVTGAVAQTGGLTVFVVDGKDRPLTGASVTIGHETGYIGTTERTTGESGRIDFPVLRAGEGYSIEVTLDGYHPCVRGDLKVTAGHTLVLRAVKIPLGEEIGGYVWLGASSSRFSDFLLLVDDTPMRSRIYQNVLALEPGVQDTDGSGNLNIHGSLPRDFRAVVNGVDNVDPTNGRSLGQVNLESIETMEFIAEGAGVEYGGAQGGFARIRQKQGGNEHEGRVEFHWQTSKLDGAEDHSAAPDPEFDTYQPSFQFTGPLIENRLWYRVSYDRRDAEIPVDTLTGLEILEWDAESRNAQLAWQVSPRNRLALEFRKNPAEGSNLGVSNRIGSRSARALKRDVETWSATWTAVPSPRAHVDTVISWQDVTWTTPATTPIGNDCLPFLEETHLSRTYCSDSSRSLVSGSWYRAERDRRERLTVKNRSTVYAGRFLGAEHQLKLGFDIENERYSRGVEERPFVNLGAVAPEAGPDGGVPEPGDDPWLSGYGLAINRLSVPVSDDLRATGTDWAFYVEDQFKPTTQLSVALGARVDREEISSKGWSPFDPAAELVSFSDYVGAASTPIQIYWRMLQWPSFFTGNEDPLAMVDRLQDLLCEGLSGHDLVRCQSEVLSHTHIQPLQELESQRRATDIHLSNTNLSGAISVAWSPWSNGKTAIRASAGRRYGKIPLVVSLLEQEPVHTPLEYHTVAFDPDDCPPPNTDDPDPTGGGCGRAVLGGPIVPVATARIVDPDLATPYQDEVTLKIERELWTATSVSLAYVRRDFRDQLQDENVNLASGDLGRCMRQNQSYERYVTQSPGTSQMSCSASPMPCQFDGDCPTGESCGYYFDLGGPTGWLTDPYSGVKYPDTNPGFGDGFVDPVTGSTDDNCFGDPLVIVNDDPCPPWDPSCETIYTVRRPDDRSDLYVQSPFWGDVYRVGNLNRIDYEAVVLELVRRQYRSWEMNASYTWSEIRSEGEDLLLELLDDSTLRGNVPGFEPRDQTHVVKLNATAITPWGFRCGTSVSWQSGLPYSVLAERIVLGSNAPIMDAFTRPTPRPRQTYPSGARNDRRNEAYWNIDLALTKEFLLARGVGAQLRVEVFNLLDDDTAQIHNPYFGRGVQINGRNEALRRFGRSWQVGARISF